MTARVGLIIPSSNRMVEQEMVPAFPAGIAGHVARLRMTGANRLPFDQLLPRIGDAVRALTDARCDVVAFHCTANSMEGGKAGEEQILATLARAGAPRATTTITAIQRAFSTLGARRIVLVTPYSASTTEHEAEFLREVGYDVLSAQGFALQGSDVWHSVPIRSVAELTSKEVVVGATTPGTTMVDFPQLMNEVLGFKFKIVRGYQGTPQINLAIERGEVQGMGGLGWASVKAQTPHWISERKIRVLAQYGFKRYAELADVPTMLELARSDADRQAMTMLFARTEYGRPYFLPPDVPVERVAALRRAFDATMIDPAFLAEATRVQFDVDPLTGEQVQALVGELAATPREVVARVRAALEAPAEQ